LATHLNSFFLEVNFESELLPEDDVGVVRLLKGGFQLLELLLGENRSVASFSLGRWRAGGAVHAPRAQGAGGRVCSRRRDGRVVVAGVEALVRHGCKHTVHNRYQL